MLNINDFGGYGSQGEVDFQLIDELPEGLTRVPSEAGLLILGHSETGHHHVVKESSNVELYSANDNKGTLFLVTKNNEVELEHMRDNHTHKSWLFPANKVVRFNTTREASDNELGWVRALD